MSTGAKHSRPTEPAIGVMFANGSRSAEPDHALALARAAERAGCESLWAVQHVAIPVAQASRYPYSDLGTVPGGPAIAIPDPLIWLAWVGAQTKLIRLATGVLVLPQQHPLVVAKQVATLDRLIGGRTILGVGAGWLREEFVALDADFEHRGRRMEEQISALRAAWSPGTSASAGEHVAFASVHVEPKPSRMVPIVVGGHTRVAAARAGRLGDGFFPLGRQGVALEALIDVMRKAAADAGRSPDVIELTAEAPRTSADAQVHARLGVRRVVINAPNCPTDEVDGTLHELVARTRERLEP